jgi:hypothetical protein
MRMPPPHLALELGGHLRGGELLPLFRDHQLESEVQQQVAQLTADGIARALTKRMVELQHFFDQVRAQGLPGLHPVPGTTGAKVAHHRDRTSKR